MGTRKSWRSAAALRSITHRPSHGTTHNKRRKIFIDWFLADVTHTWLEDGGAVLRRSLSRASRNRSCYTWRVLKRCLETMVKGDGTGRSLQIE